MATCFACGKKATKLYVLRSKTSGKASGLACSPECAQAVWFDAKKGGHKFAKKLWKAVKELGDANA